MKLPYIGKLNQGNEALNLGQSFSVEEKPIGTASNKQIAEHVHMLNGLIPTDVAEAVLNVLGDVYIHFMAQGYRVPFTGRGYSLGSMYADVKLKKNVTIDDVKAIDPTVTTLTLQDFDKYVKPSDIVVRAYFETEDKFNERLRSELEGIDRAELVEKAFIPRKENQGGENQGNQGGNGGNNPDDGTLG